MSLDYLDMMYGISDFLTIYGVFIIVYVLCAYVFQSFLLSKIGIKLGMKESWMAYVPFVRDYYQLKMIDQPFWKIFFFGETGLLCTYLLSLILALLFPFTAVSGIFAALYILVYAVIWFIYMFVYLPTFGFHPALSFSVFFLPIVLPIVNTLIGFDKRIQAKGASSYNSQNPTPNSSNSEIGMIGVSGVYAGAKFDMSDGKEITIGRDSSVCNVIYDDSTPSLSRIHCKIYYNAASNNYMVTDSSKNGLKSSDKTNFTPNVPTAIKRGTIIYVNDSNSFRLN